MFPILPCVVLYILSQVNGQVLRVLCRDVISLRSNFLLVSAEFLQVKIQKSRTGKWLHVVSPAACSLLYTIPESPFLYTQHLNGQRGGFQNRHGMKSRISFY